MKCMVISGFGIDSSFFFLFTYIIFLEQFFMLCIRGCRRNHTYRPKRWSNQIHYVYGVLFCIIKKHEIGKIVTQWQLTSASWLVWNCCVSLVVGGCFSFFSRLLHWPDQSAKPKKKQWWKVKTARRLFIHFSTQPSYPVKIPPRYFTLQLL